MTICISILAFIAQILRVIALNVNLAEIHEKSTKDECKNMKFGLLTSGLDHSIFGILSACIVTSIVNVICYAIYLLKPQKQKVQTEEDDSGIPLNGSTIDANDEHDQKRKKSTKSLDELSISQAPIRIQ